MFNRLTFAVAISALLFSLQANGDQHKKLPPKGIEIESSDQQALVDRVKRIRASYRDVESRDQSDQAAWYPDVEVYARAVELAIKQDLFFKENQIKQAMTLLDDAEKRLQLAKEGRRGLELLGWNGKSSKEPVLLVGGFRSSIDDSVQPYGLVIPANFKQPNAPVRMDVWLHGRGDNKTEIPFLWERKSSVGIYSPDNTIVLHPFGRHCNAFKFAGEVDVYEAMRHVSRLIQVDSQRTALRGFSMGGAGVWHIAAHDPMRWFAVNPGAGFVDTIVYQNWNDKTPYPIDETRKSLLNWYDVLPWSSNLQNTNVVAYSGEVDKQRQAAERVVAKLKKQDIPFEHVIGAKMGHKIDPPSREKINQQLAKLAKSPPNRKTIDFTTYHLRYHRAGNIHVTGLQQQFKPGRVKAEWINDQSVNIETSGITDLEIFADSDQPIDFLIDGDSFSAKPVRTHYHQSIKLHRDRSWKPSTDDNLRKRPGMQGPIDDAFCSRFVFVIPSRPAAHGVAQRFIDREMKYAAQRWRTLMRGRVRFVKDTEVTDKHIENANLICFGDFTSNRYLAKVANRLPMDWSKEKLSVGDQDYDPATSVLAFCFPNPDNPNRYVVANSGMTFREFSNVSNSRQIAMLPDWVVFDAESEDDGIFAGTIRDQGFFDEDWQVK